MEPRDITFSSLQLLPSLWCVREQLEPSKASRDSGNGYYELTSDTVGGCALRVSDSPRGPPLTTGRQKCFVL